ncbi:MAG: hypothetical protein K0S33_1155 [Bacteroidetes bacterium]|jgi:hypothetical protein|nr:hypothetical protein [Bacteroidota bacterium]
MIKISKTITLVIAIIAISSCKKDPKGASMNTYPSLAYFFAQYAPVMQTYTISGTTGGSFTSPQGTTVVIPANAFSDPSGAPVLGNVTIHFKDIYKKSDMLFAGMPTMMYNKRPLKSGGEFFIKATANSLALTLTPGKKITINQPVSLTGGIDPPNPQLPFVFNDSIPLGFTPGGPIGPAGPGGFASGWILSPADSVITSANNYIFSLYQFSMPADSGTWCNSDNNSYFSAYPQTTLTLIPDEPISEYHTSVYLIFTNISSMVHVYDNGTNFPYQYAPQGLQCTIVAVGTKEGKLYSSFIPVSIGPNHSQHFSMHLTNSAEFADQLDALN